MKVRQTIWIPIIGIAMTYNAMWKEENPWNISKIEFMGSATWQALWIAGIIIELIK